MFEEEFVCPFERRLLTQKDQLTLLQRSHLVSQGPIVWFVTDRSHRVIPEEPADDRCALQRAALILRQVFQARLQEARQRGRDTDGHHSFRVYTPGISVDNDDPFVNEHLHEFLDIVRVTLRARDDQLPQ